MHIGLDNKRIVDHWYILSVLKKEIRNLIIRKGVNQDYYHVSKSDLSFLTQEEWWISQRGLESILNLSEF